MSKHFYQTLRKIGLPLFLATILGTFADQWLTLKMENQLTAPSGAGPLIWLYGGLSLILSLIYPLITMLLILSLNSDKGAMWFLRLNGKQTLLEQMRAWGKAMLWSLLFIFPGLIQFFRLVFVPFIVCFDPDYSLGAVDALEKSKALSKGKLISIAGLFIFFALLFPALMTLVDEYKLLWKTPLAALLICFVEMTTNFLFVLVLWKMYQKQNLKQKVIL